MSNEEQNNEEVIEESTEGTMPGVEVPAGAEMPGVSVELDTTESVEAPTQTAPEEAQGEPTQPEINNEAAPTTDQPDVDPMTPIESD